jgi:hypothetical protein
VRQLALANSHSTSVFPSPHNYVASPHAYFYSSVGVRGAPNVRALGNPVINQHGNQAFEQAARVFKDTGNVQAVAERSVAASKEFYHKAAAAAKEGANAFSEIVENEVAAFVRTVFPLR